MFKVYSNAEITKKRREIFDQAKKFLRPNFTTFTKVDLRKIY